MNKMLKESVGFCFLIYFFAVAGIHAITFQNSHSISKQTTKPKKFQNNFYGQVAHALFPFDIRGSTPPWVYGIAGLVMRGKIKDSLLIEAFVEESFKNKNLALALGRVYPVETRDIQYKRKGMWMVNLGLSILGIKLSVPIGYTPSFIDLVLLSNIVRLRAEGQKKIALDTYWFGVWKGIANPIKKRLAKFNVKITTSSWVFKIAGTNMIRKAKPYFNNFTVDTIIKALEKK